MNSPLDNAINEFSPASRPIASVDNGNGSGSDSQDRHTNHFLPYLTDGTGLHITEYWAVDFSLDLNWSTEQRQPNGGLSDLEPALRIGDTVILIFAFVSRIAWDFLCFEVTKEGLKGQVNADGDILQDLRMYGFEFGPENVRF